MAQTRISFIIRGITATSLFAITAACNFSGVGDTVRNTTSTVTDAVTSPFNRPADIPKKLPPPDGRGVITLNDRQLMVAAQGDTITKMARRIGLIPDQLATFNGLPLNTRLRTGQILALPKLVTGQSAATTATTGQTPETITTEKLPSQTVASGQKHTVEPGETTYSIARLYGVTTTALAGANSLDNNFNIRVGQNLIIPKDGSQPGQTTAVSSPPSSADQLPPDTQVATLPESPNMAAQQTNSSRMKKPVSGKAIRAFGSGNEGVDYGAAAGSTVSAASPGEVALISDSTGSNGTIILIRHPDNIFTVYSRVTNVTVKKGQKVTAGQKIAEVAAGNPANLHFEVRNGTDAVDPGKYL